MPIQVDPEVEEIRLGAGEGLSFADFDATYRPPTARDPYAPLAP